MIEFHNTKIGRKFFDADFPRLISVLERIANELEKSNKSSHKLNKMDERIKHHQLKEINERNNKK
jgi:hypothetical protein